MLDFQERMAIGKAEHKRMIEETGGNPFPCRARTGDEYRNMAADDRAELEIDWHAWHAEQDELAGSVDADPAGDRQDETEEETSRRPQKQPSPALGDRANSPLTQGKFMNAKTYIKLLKKLDLSPYKAGPALGISPRMSMRYSAGTHPIPATIAKLVRALVLLGRHDV